MSSISTAEKISDIFRTVEPPEDCTFRLSTAGLGDSLDGMGDCAVILAGNAADLLSYQKTGGERVVFLSSAEDLSGLDSRTLSAADDLWIMPDKEHPDAALLNLYFSRLLNDMKEQCDRRRMEICFQTVIDSLPDLVWFKDNDGRHLIVNNEFCGVVEKTKKQIYRQGHNYIWDVPEDSLENGASVCAQSEEVVVRERRTYQFEEQITTKNGIRQLITYKSPLIDSDGTIFGTCGMGHDITDLRNVTKELRIIIDSIPFGMAIVDNSGIVVAINRFFAKFFPEADNIIGHSFAEWNDRLDKEKLGSSQREDEYRIRVKGKEYIVTFREEPMVDIFGENFASIQLIRDVTMQYQFEQQNIRYANTDFLTGLNNRRSLFDYMNKLGRNTMISLIMLDLDKFKSVNDTYGHAAGDEALKITAYVLTECFTDGFIARLGGDEFLVALVGDRDSDELEQRTQHLLDTLLARYKVKEDFHLLSASAGIAQERLPVCDMRSIENLLKRSDDALYTAKQTGRARYCVSRNNE
jgi:diguanylate cyclase (GGDEF)-like protein/PAS domain S-box-containing protein